MSLEQYHNGEHIDPFLERLENNYWKKPIPKKVMNVFKKSDDHRKKTVAKTDKIARLNAMIEAKRGEYMEAFNCFRRTPVDFLKESYRKEYEILFDQHRRLWKYLLKVV